MDQERALDLLIRADLFELVLQQRYLGTKRFSLEGVTALIPLVDEDSRRGRAARCGGTGDGHEPSRAPERDRAMSPSDPPKRSLPDLKTSIRAAFSAAAT